MSLLAKCCGLDSGQDESLKESIDSEAFSPILKLDELVADWAYRGLARIHNGNKGLCGRKFPKRKHMDLQVLWDKVVFKHNEPEEYSKGRKQHSESNGEGNSKGNGELSPQSLDMKHGYDPYNQMLSCYQEKFSIKYDNTTDAECETTLTADRSVKSTYEVEVTKSVQTGHTLQMALQVGEPFNVGPSYEFSRLLESCKGERNTEETDISFNTECPVKIPKKTSAEAIITTTYQTYKQTLNIKSVFSGTINVIASEKKRRRGKRLYQVWTDDVANMFHLMQKDKEMGKAVSQYIDVDRDLDEVSYTSVATFSSSCGVDRYVKIIQKPLN